jgi:hypothetical protein
MEGGELYEEEEGSTTGTLGNVRKPKRNFSRFRIPKREPELQFGSPTHYIRLWETCIVSNTLVTL